MWRILRIKKILFYLILPMYVWSKHRNIIRKFIIKNQYMIWIIIQNKNRKERDLNSKQYYTIFLRSSNNSCSAIEGAIHAGFASTWKLSETSILTSIKDKSPYDMIIRNENLSSKAFNSSLVIRTYASK